MITNNIETITANPAKSISVGLRPSGFVHLGNLTALTLAGIIAGKTGAEMHLTICDIDMPSGETKPSALYFKYQQVGGKTRAKATAEELATFTEDLGNWLGINVRTDFLSDVQATPEYRAGLESIISRRGALRWIYHGVYSETDRRVPIHPVCPCCNHTPCASSIHLKESLIKSRCRNDECDKYNEKEVIDLRDLKTEIGVHYFIDPIRDVLLEPHADVHVFGGDYNQCHGSNHVPKIDKVRKITELTGNPAPHYFIGPLLLAPEEDGSKLSKSRGTDLTLSTMQANYDGPTSFTQSMVEFVELALNHGLTHIPYRVVSEFFVPQTPRVTEPAYTT